MKSLDRSFFFEVFGDFVVFVVAVVITWITTSDAGNERGQYHDNLCDSRNNHKDHLAIGLLDLRKEVVGNLGVLVTASIDKG